ncbi:MAG: GNAT family N-acetyltransferase [Bryobacteraceae bacterium]
MSDFAVRQARASDFDALLPMRLALWDDSTAEELRRILAGPWTVGGLPAAVLIAETLSGEAAGFAEVSVRSCADGCDESRPVGYMEGWFVAGAHRRRGAGRCLLAAAEQWAREKGCREFASDTWVDNHASHRTHLALGFEEVDRCIHYRKTLG